MNKADSIVFYTGYPIKRYVEDGKINREKLFIANNTVEVKEKIDVLQKKKYFIFVGTLYRAKKIFDLLEAYKKAFEIDKTLRPLFVIGDGDEFENICNWIKENSLENNIYTKGAIYDQRELVDLYRHAIACISPGQAGLTVLNSMAYGVPFVTTQGAITGGEVFNIENGVNGLIINEGIDSLVNTLLNLDNDENETYRLSINAQNHYFQKRTIEIMVEGLRNAIEYAYKSKL